MLSLILLRRRRCGGGGGDDGLEGLLGIFRGIGSVGRDLGGPGGLGGLPGPQRWLKLDSELLDQGFIVVSCRFFILDPRSQIIKIIVVV